jgi:hypothetical protein
MQLLTRLRALRASSDQVFDVLPYLPDKPVAFMSIPKTSSNALTSGFMQAIAPQRVVFGFDVSHFGTFRSFDSMAPDVRRDIYRDPDELPADADFIAGHMSCATLARSYPDAQLVTFLREPVSRILSHWLFWRSLPDDQLTGWGDWADFVKKARGSLTDFLSCRQLACHLDNISVRMLVWPHPLIPEDDFISAQHDNVLLRCALKQLQLFRYSDVIENPDLRNGLKAWLCREFPYGTSNETRPIPEEHRTLLDRELTPEAFALLDGFTRLDNQLWMALARCRMPSRNAQSVREKALMRGMARFTRLAGAVSL